MWLWVVEFFSSGSSALGAKSSCFHHVYGIWYFTLHNCKDLSHYPNNWPLEWGNEDGLKRNTKMMSGFSPSLVFLHPPQATLSAQLGRQIECISSTEGVCAHTNNIQASLITIDCRMFKECFQLFNYQMQFNFCYHINSSLITHDGNEFIMEKHCCSLPLIHLNYGASLTLSLPSLCRCTFVSERQARLEAVRELFLAAYSSTVGLKSSFPSPSGAISGLLEQFARGVGLRGTNTIVWTKLPLLFCCLSSVISDSILCLVAMNHQDKVSYFSWSP